MTGLYTTMGKGRAAGDGGITLVGKGPGGQNLGEGGEFFPF